MEVEEVGPQSTQFKYHLENLLLIYGARISFLQIQIHSQYNVMYVGQTLCSCTICGFVLFERKNHVEYICAKKGKDFFFIKFMFLRRTLSFLLMFFTIICVHLK